LVLAVLHLHYYVLGTKLNKLQLTFYINVFKRFLQRFLRFNVFVFCFSRTFFTSMEWSCCHGEIFFTCMCCSRNAKRVVGYQLKRDVTQDDVIAASCRFCGEAYGTEIGDACHSEEATTRACVTNFLTELKAFSRSRGW